MTELNWLIDLGFMMRELRGLPGNTLLLLADQYEQFALEHNMKLVLQYIDRQNVLRFLVRYPNDCIIRAIGVNDECDWECVLGRIELFRDGLWL